MDELEDGQAEGERYEQGGIMKRCVVHNNNAMPKDRHCSGWWWANGGDPKAGLAEPCEFKPDPQQSDGEADG